MITWRERLKEILEERQLSMREVSIASGCGHGYLYKILRENSEPTLDKLMKVANYLDLSLSWLLTGLDVSKQTEDFTLLYESLSPEQRERVFLLLQSMTPPKDP